MQPQPEERKRFPFLSLMVGQALPPLLQLCLLSQLLSHPITPGIRVLGVGSHTAPTTARHVPTGQAQGDPLACAMGTTFLHRYKRCCDMGLQQPHYQSTQDSFQLFDEDKTNNNLGHAGAGGSWDSRNAGGDKGHWAAAASNIHAAHWHAPEQVGAPRAAAHERGTCSANPSPPNGLGTLGPPNGHCSPLRPASSPGTPHAAVAGGTRSQEQCIPGSNAGCRSSHTGTPG